MRGGSRVGYRSAAVRLQASIREHSRTFLNQISVSETLKSILSHSNFTVSKSSIIGF